MDVQKIKYVCKKDFALQEYDDYGFSKDTYIKISKGDIFELKDTEYRYVGGSETVRLENDDAWIEILEKTFLEYFEAVVVEGEKK